MLSHRVGIDDKIGSASDGRNPKNIQHLRRRGSEGFPQPKSTGGDVLYSYIIKKSSEDTKTHEKKIRPRSDFNPDDRTKGVEPQKRTAI